MKKYLFLISIIFLSCQEEITLDLPQAEEKLVVEGAIEPGFPPYVILTNDPIPPSYIKKGVIIEPFAVVCTRSTILPGKKIGFGSFVGANSLVNLNLKPEMIGSGNPFKIRANINTLKIPNSKKQFIDNQCRTIDIFPTISDIIGLDRQESISGRTLLALFGENELKEFI